MSVEPVLVVKPVTMTAVGAPFESTLNGPIFDVGTNSVPVVGERLAQPSASRHSAGRRAVMTMVALVEALEPAVSVTVATVVYVPADVGLPLRAPSVDITTPGGRPVAVHEYAPEPPVAVAPPAIGPPTKAPRGISIEGARMM